MPASVLRAQTVIERRGGVFVTRRSCKFLLRY
jgi:hypothetical protein